MGVPAVVSPQDTIEHTHLRGPEKLVRTWIYDFFIFFLFFLFSFFYIYEEIASDGKLRKKKLIAKIKKMRWQL